MKLTKRQLRRIIREAEGSTRKYDDDSALRGGQSKLPDKLQKGIIDKTVEDREGREEEEREEKNESVRITRRQLRSIIREAGDWREALGPPPDQFAPGWHPNMSQEWERDAEAGYRAELAAEKKAFLTGGVQARWEDEFQIDDDDQAEMIRKVLSSAYNEIWKQV